MTVDEQLFEAAQRGDADQLGALLDAHPDQLQARDQPYEWSLLHHAAFRGHLQAVNLLLTRGLDVNTRERGDNTYPMHWSAAAGHLEVVRRLADAGGDVVGQGDDHALEVIGWATCWDHPHDAIANFLVSRGARHHIFSAISMNLADEVRRIVATDPAAINARMSRNEDHRMPLHYAVLRNRPEMVALLMELGADPLAVDGSGFTAAAYATSVDIDRPVMARIREMTARELDSAARGQREAHVGLMDLIAALAVHDYTAAEALLRANPRLTESYGALHLMSKRGDAVGGRWLLDHGVDVNGRWPHWDAEVTPLHLAAAFGHADVVRLLLTSGANPHIRDSKHDGDSLGWAEHFTQPQTLEILREHASRT